MTLTITRLKERRGGLARFAWKNLKKKTTFSLTLASVQDLVELCTCSACCSGSA